MEEQKKQMKIKSITLLLLLFLLLFEKILSAQIPIIQINVERNNDSLRIEISNISEKDTILFSLYGQTKISGKWITSNYDLFCDVTNPKTSIFIVYPIQKYVITSLEPKIIYTDKKIIKGKGKCSKCKRLVLIGYNIINNQVKYQIFSNSW